MSTMIRVGIFGAGGIAAPHAKAFQKMKKHARVVAVAEPRPERADAIREMFGNVEIYPDYQQLLGQAEVDAVDILLPHHLHMESTLAAACAGKHVLVEKCMARNIHECDKMIEASEEAGVTLTVCHDRRYHAEWQALKDIVDSGVLGQIFYCRLDHNQDVSLPAGSWAFSKDGIGGGAIMRCLTHQIDALRWYGGEVRSVSAMTYSDASRMEGEFLGLVNLKMQSGAVASPSINWWTRSHVGPNSLWYEMVHVCGTKGEAYHMLGKGTFARLHDVSDEAAVSRYGKSALTGFVKLKTGNHGGHEGCISAWIQNLKNGHSSPTTDGKICRGTVEVAEAAYIAVSTEKEVHLPISAREWKNSPTPSGQKRRGGMAGCSKPGNPGRRAMRMA